MPEIHIFTHVLISLMILVEHHVKLITVYPFKTIDKHNGAIAIVPVKHSFDIPHVVPSR